LFAMIGYGLAGVSYLLAALTLQVASFWVFAACAIAVGFFNDLIMSPSWASCQDIGRRYSAIVSGTMNMVGNLGAGGGLLVSGLILKSYSETDAAGVTVTNPEGYVTCFFLYAVIYAIGVCLWLLIDPTKPIIPDEPAQQAEPQP